MKKIRISAIRYANTIPFNYGIISSLISKEIIIEYDHPSECASKLIDNRADIGLVPIAEIGRISEATIIGNYCIGTNSPVRTVQLVSNTPFEKTDTIYLDYRSRTSVNLARILARHHWKREFKWETTTRDFSFYDLPDKAAMVIIGDQCFELENYYNYKRDLSTEWKDMTGLPFVFACWVANKHIDPLFIERFNKALEKGINDIEGSVKALGSSSLMPAGVLRSYLNDNIDYHLNDSKKEAMKLFFHYLNE